MIRGALFVSVILTGFRPRIGHARRDDTRHDCVQRACDRPCARPL